MSNRRSVTSADDVPKLRKDADRAIDRYSRAADDIERVFFEHYGENLAPDVLRLVAARFLEIAEQREPAPVTAQGSGRAYGWRKLTVVTRDEATLPTAHLIASLRRSDWTPQEVCDELTARRITTISGRFDWRANVVNAIAERERGRQPVWTGAVILSTEYGFLKRANALNPGESAQDEPDETPEPIAEGAAS